MTGDLNMGNYKITNLANPTNNTDGANKKYIDDNYLKLSGGTITGPIYLPSSSTVNTSQALNIIIASVFYVEKRNPYVNTRFNMVNHKIIKL